MTRDAAYLSLQEAARRLGVSDWTVRQGIRNRQLAARRVGRRGVYRILETDFERWIADGAPTSTERYEETASVGGASNGTESARRDNT